MEFRIFTTTSIWSIILELSLLILGSSSSGGGQSDKLALLALKAEMNDTVGYLRSWNESVRVCDWHGITCGRRHPRVTVLDLQSSQLKGQLSSHIGNLSFLRVLNLQNNSLGRIIPKEIGSLSKLQVLNLGKNNFRGEIPACFGNLSFLHMLSVEQNNLVGAIPSSLGSLASLSRLGLSSNNLQGGIPKILGECKNLLALDLSQNNLSGLIPLEILSLLSLLVLNLSSNRFTGSIPDKVNVLVNLVALDVSENKFSGLIPSSLGSCESLATLHLEGNLLEGRLPSSLQSMRGIEDFDFSRNRLSGRIPNDFGGLPFLHNLNLSFNDFDGAVPLKGVFQNTSAFSIMGNTRLCGGISSLKLPRCIPNESYDSEKDLTFWVKIACGVCVGFVIIVFCIVLIFRSRKALCILLLHWLKKGIVQLTTISSSLKVSPSEVPYKATDGFSSLRVSHLKVSYGDLLKATNGFSSRNLIGGGSFGSVYRGILHQEERIVAVKVLNHQRSRDSFIAECEALKSIRHRNVVKLLTACASIDFKGNDFKALVYEFMMNGSLEEWLHSSADRVAGAPVVQGYLNLVQRVNIAIDIASALDYMHNYFHKPIVHCDLKPSNILLDNDMNACVGDFGLARYLSNPLDEHETSVHPIVGSIGYVAPEYGMGSPVSTYGDVYSYGILLLEMFTSKKPTADMFKDDLNLHKFVLMTLPECVEEIYDPMFLQSTEHITITSARTRNRNHVQSDQRQLVEKCLVSIASIGVACSVGSPKARMEIGKVLAELRLIRDVLDA